MTKCRAVVLAAMLVAAVPMLWPSIVSAGWSDDLKGARKLEVLGQRDDPRIASAVRSLVG